MASRDLPGTVVVLDLDDTLYPEEDYMRSGIKAVCRMVAKTHGCDTAAAVEQALARHEKDPLGLICSLARLPPAAKESLLWVYRLHVPEISLSTSVRSVVAALEAR
jgi:putative hydrolase of the HAD superfamily